MLKAEKKVDQLLTKLRKLLPQISEKYQIQSLEVFGSFVRGEEKDGSDLDLLVAFNQVPSLFQFIALENYLSDQLGIQVDLVMKDSLKPTIGKRILEEAQSVE
jgi:predicted nucleotidyltransferase